MDPAKLHGNAYYRYWNQRATQQGEAYVGRHGMGEKEIHRQGLAFWQHLLPLLPTPADIQAQSDPVVVEFGCGWGRMTWRLAQRYPTARVYGIDMVEFALRHGRKYYKEITFIRDDHYPVHVPKASLIMTCTCLQHITDPTVFNTVARSFEDRTQPGAWLVMLENATKKKRASHLHDMAPEDYVNAFAGFDFQDPVLLQDKAVDPEDMFLLRGQRRGTASVG